MTLIIFQRFKQNVDFYNKHIYQKYEIIIDKKNGDEINDDVHSFYCDDIIDIWKCGED